MIASSRDVLSPSLLALLNHFVQIRRWTYLERSTLHSRMLGNELNCVIQNPLGGMMSVTAIYRQ
jgi:hypothetical protein